MPALNWVIKMASSFSGRSGQLLRRLLLGLRVPDPFWSLWGARIIGAVLMSAIVAFCLKPFETGVREFVDANVQLGLLARLGSAASLAPACRGNSEPQHCISVVGIDDAEHRNVFQQRSPLDPDKLRELFDALRGAPPRVVAIDLDLSPAAPDEWPARRRLFDSLRQLAAVSHLVMVCPQGYSGGSPGALDEDWLALFGSEVHFASPDLSENGLYFDAAQGLTPLGMRAAQLSRVDVGAQASVRQPKDWHTACLNARVSASASAPDLKVIRPAAVESLNFSQALRQPEALAGRLAFVGGKWGAADQFLLRGQSEPFYGVSLHAWVAATELAPLFRPSKATELAIDVWVGLLSGLYFAAVWAAIVRHRHSFARRSFFYLLFLGGALILPVAWVMTTARLAEIGIVLGTAGMILSAAADSFLSAHEGHLEVEQGGGETSRHWRKVLAWGGGAMVLALTWRHGESWSACLAAGVLLGLLMAFLDASGPALELAPDMAERSWDLLARLIWLLLKLAALWLAMTQATADEARPVWALFGGFVLVWAGALYLRRYQLSRG